MPSLAFNYNNWQFWGPYDPANGYLGEQKVTFDGLNKLILVNEGITELDFREDIYSAWKEWILDPTQINAKWEEAVSAIGGDTLPGNRQLGTTYFLENGWRMRTWEGDHELTVTGNVFTREGESLFVSTLNPWTITINLNTATIVETILPELSLSAGDVTAIADASADAVWAEQINGTDTAVDLLLAIPDNVWDEIIDVDKNYTAREKLKRIATKIQDIALD
jgi:hypothetical protein